MSGTLGRRASATRLAAAPPAARAAPTACQRLLALLAVSFAVMLRGTGYLFARLTLAEVQPFTQATLRNLVTLLVLVPLALRERRAALAAVPMPWKRVAAMGLLGVGVFYAAYNFGMLYASTVEAGLIFAVSPALTAALAVLFLGERVSRIRWVGIALSVAGVAFITLAGAGSEAPNPLLGGAFMLVGVLAWSSYTLLGKRLDPRLPQTVVTTAITLTGMAIIVPLTAVELLLHGQGPISPRAWLLMAHLGLFNGALAYLAFNLGLRYLEASLTGTLLQLNTVVAVAVGVLVLAEPLTTTELLGGAAVLLGVWLATRPAETREP